MFVKKSAIFQFARSVSLLYLLHYHKCKFLVEIFMYVLPRPKKMQMTDGARDGGRSRQAGGRTVSGQVRGVVRVVQPAGSAGGGVRQRARRDGAWSMEAHCSSFQSGYCVGLEAAADDCTVGKITQMTDGALAHPM